MRGSELVITELADVSAHESARPSAGAVLTEQSGFLLIYLIIRHFLCRWWRQIAHKILRCIMKMNDCIMSLIWAICKPAWIYSIYSSFLHIFIFLHVLHVFVIHSLISVTINLNQHRWCKHITWSMMTPCPCPLKASRLCGHEWTQVYVIYNHPHPSSPPKGWPRT